MCMYNYEVPIIVRSHNYFHFFLRPPIDDYTVRLDWANGDEAHVSHVVHCTVRYFAIAPKSTTSVCCLTPTNYGWLHAFGGEGSSWGKTNEHAHAFGKRPMHAMIGPSGWSASHLVGRACSSKTICCATRFYEHRRWSRLMPVWVCRWTSSASMFSTSLLQFQQNPT